MRNQFWYSYYSLKIHNGSFVIFFKNLLKNSSKIKFLFRKLIIHILSKKTSKRVIL
jgi:hypothetical protein